MTYISDFIVSEAKKNDQKFDSPEEEEKYLISNHAADKDGSKAYFDEVYVFPPATTKTTTLTTPATSTNLTTNSTTNSKRNSKQSNKSKKIH
jgi:hypothetical protein